MVALYSAEVAYSTPRETLDKIRRSLLKFALRHHKLWTTTITVKIDSLRADGSKITIAIKIQSRIEWRNHDLVEKASQELTYYVRF
jgi:hypothetical protein